MKDSGGGGGGGGGGGLVLVALFPSKLCFLPLFPLLFQICYLRFHCAHLTVTPPSHLNTPKRRHLIGQQRNNLSGANYLTFEEGGGILKKKVIRTSPSSVHVQWAGQKTSDWEALNFRIFHERIPPDPFR